MKKIEFRAKCNKRSRFAGEWVYGGCVVCKKDRQTLIIDALSDNCTITCHVVKKTVGQFTGLRDRKGKKIFEGDIMKVWCGGTLQAKPYLVEDMKELYFEMMRDDRCLAINDCEIIGNVHDNPELMEGEVK